MAHDTRTGPRDVFLQLLIVIALYLSAVHLGILCYQFINIAFPDPLTGVYAVHATQPIRWAIAMLVVVFPVLVWSSVRQQRLLTDRSEQRKLLTRRWLLHLTLFITALVIIGDLVALIRGFLEGELTIRFALKTLTVFAISTGVLRYVLWDLRSDDDPTIVRRMRRFGYAVTCVVVAAVIAGFILAGSPQSERLRRFDDQRVNELQNIQAQIVDS